MRNESSSPVWIRTQDLLNTSQTILPLSHSGKIARECELKGTVLTLSPLTPLSGLGSKVKHAVKNVEWRGLWDEANRLEICFTLALSYQMYPVAS